MNLKVLLLFSILALSSQLYGQLRTYLGIEAGPSRDLNRVTDPGNIFFESRIPGNTLGITIKQELFPNIFIETGVTHHGYSGGINIRDNRPDNAGWKVFDALLIPARLLYKMQLVDYPYSITPRFGYQFGYIFSSPTPYQAESVISDPYAAVVEYTLTENNPSSSYMHLLEFGISAEYIFKNSWELGLGLSHYSGLSEVANSTINMAVSSIPAYTSGYSADGRRIQMDARISIPISNIWENKDLRIRKSIEQSRGMGRSSIRPQNYIYFGGDFGALWRGFRTTNPAVGSRPIEGKGVFRYSNMHTGTYVGFLLKNNLGIDLGAYYQRSSLFFSLMYDHEADFVTRTRAPLFLEFPLRVRYFHDAYKGRILIIPSFGVSALTHFAGSDYSTGSNTFSYSTLSGPGTASIDYSGIRTSRLGLMVKAGVGVEYRIPIRFPLYANTTLEYSHGLKDIDEIRVRTSILENPSVSTVKYMGSGWKLTFGARIPVLLGKENRKCGATLIPIP